MYIFLEPESIVRDLQTSLNSEYRCGLVVDGLYGNATKNTVKKYYLKEGYIGKHVMWLQKALISRGYKIKDDGIFGNETKKAVEAYQKSKGLEVDGYAGYDTHTAIINE